MAREIPLRASPLAAYARRIAPYRAASRRIAPHRAPLTHHTAPMPKLHPHLIIADCPRAIDFYKAAFDARELSRYADPKLGGQIVCAELAIGDQQFSISEEHREWHNDAPTSLGGSPVILTLEVADVDAVGASLERAGATVVYPIADQFYGDRSGRFRDPFGHIWRVTQKIKEMSQAEIQAGVDAYE